MAGSISVEGMNEVLAAIRRVAPQVQQATMKGLQEGGLAIIADAKDNLRQNHSVVTGLLRASGKVKKVDDETLDVGFFDTQNRQGYAEYVEYGRRSGRFPPLQNLAAWAYKKFHLKDWRAANALGFQIARKIAREGSTPHPFFKPAIEKNKETIVKKVREAVGAALDKINPF